MAAVDPVVLASGIVREVVINQFIDRESGEVQERGWKVTLLTRVGFLQFNLPQTEDVNMFPEGGPAVVWLRIRTWELRGRAGTTLVFDSYCGGKVAELLGSEMATA